MALSTTQKKRLEKIGAFLIEEGFSDVLVDINLLPKIHIFDRMRASVLTSGSYVERICNVLNKMGTTGEAFAFFATHRPDLFSQQERNAFEKLAHSSKNKTMYFDSQTANKLLTKLDAKTDFEPLPYLITPFASYYKGKNRIAKLYHTHALTDVHADLLLIREIIANTPLQETKLLTIICEFVDFIVDYFSKSELKTIKRTTTGALFSSENGVSISETKKILKTSTGKDVANALVERWLAAVFEQKKILYDIYSWQWANNAVSYQDIEPIVVLNDRELKTILTFFTALATGDEQTAAACVISMCDATQTSLDHAERLVSAHHAQKKHVFECGVAILEDASHEGMRIKPAFAKVAASASQLIFIARQFAPHTADLFDPINSYLAAHDIMLQQLVQAISTQAPQLEADMKQKNHNVQTTTYTHGDAATQAIEKLAIEIDKSSNRISYSAIIAAFTIAGALLVTSASQTGLLMLGVPFFVIAFVASLMLISSIAKEPK